MNRIDHERSDGCNQPTDCGQHGVHGVLAGQLVRGLVGVPQSASTPSDVPVGQIVDDELLEVASGLVEVLGLELRSVGVTDCSEPGQNPAIQT